MPGHIVFVRFFLDYHPTFPFDRIVHLDDNALSGTLDNLAKEWLKEPANRDLFRNARIELKKNLREKKKQIKEWNEACLAQPGRNSRVPRAPSEEVEETLQKRIRTPNFEEIAALAGWGGGTVAEGLHYGISRRYPVSRFDAKALAYAATKALQDRVEELARCAYDKKHWGEDESWYTSANPRFNVVSESELPLHDLATARAKLNRLEGPVPKSQSIEEGLLRFYLPEIRGTLAEIEALHTPNKITMPPNVQDKKLNPPSTPGRPRNNMKPKIVKFVRKLRNENTPWKNIPDAVFERFKVRYTSETLRGYLKDG